ncbi:MAG: hypothetical protein ACI8VI_001062, partial [Granulosicoccus sp.]
FSLSVVQFIEYMRNIHDTIPRGECHPNTLLKMYRRTASK